VLGYTFKPVSFWYCHRSDDSLRAILHGELRGEDVIVVSNREPYIHQRRGDRIEIQRPASGLVTALAIPQVPPGLPILLAAAVGAAWGWLRPAPPAAGEDRAP
jgi:hypothetical protein